jgi:hypothetical protein
VTGKIVLMLVIMPELRDLAEKHMDNLKTLAAAMQASYVATLNGYADKYRPAAKSAEFNSDAQDYKRALSNRLKFDTCDWSEAKHKVQIEHGEELIKAGWDSVCAVLPTSTGFVQQMTAVDAYRCAAARIGASPLAGPPAGARTAIIGSQPRSVLVPAPDYPRLLAVAGFLTVPNFLGRKPGTDTVEKGPDWYERSDSFDWSTWWLKMGNWEASMLGWVASSRAFFYIILSYAPRDLLVHGKEVRTKTNLVCYSSF